MADSPLTIVRGRTTQYVKPGQLIKAAKLLKPYFTNKDGSFDTERFSRLIGIVRRDKDKVQGFFPQVSYKNGHWKVDYKKERDQSRSEAEAIPVQMEWIMKKWPKYGSEDLWKRFKKHVTESRGQAFGQAKSESTPEDPVEGGHLARMRGYGVKDTTPQGIPNVGPNIIPERKYGYPVFDDEGNFIRMAPGNEPKKNDPREHFKRSDIEIAGGGMSANWMDVAAQFMMKEIYGDNITGTNVKNLTRTDKEIARDKKINIQVLAQQRDRYNQLIQQTQHLVKTGAENSYKLQRDPGVDPKTGLRKNKMPEIVNRDPTKPLFGINPNLLSIDNEKLQALSNLSTGALDMITESIKPIKAIKEGVRLGQAVSNIKENPLNAVGTALNNLPLVETTYQQMYKPIEEGRGRWKTR